MMDSICKSCVRPCLGVGTEDHTWGLPSYLWEENIQSEVVTLGPGEECKYYAPPSPLDPRTPLPSSYEGLLALSQEIDSILESESPC